MGHRHTGGVNVARISAAYGDLGKSKKYVRETGKKRPLMNDELEGLLSALTNKADVKELRAYIHASGVEVKSWAQVRREGS